MRRYGWRPDLPDQRDFKYAAIARGVPIPDTVDLRPLCSPVEDQGDLGSCVANALVGHLEFLELKAGKSVGHGFGDLSRLMLYYLARALDGDIPQDNGTTIRAAVKALAKWGTCLEPLWPYNVDRFRQKPNKTSSAAALKRRIAAYHRLENLVDLRQCLAAGYPCALGISVYESFESDQVAKTGVAPLPEKGEALLGGSVSSNMAEN